MSINSNSVYTGTLRKPQVTYSRSKDLFYSDIHKGDDVTRFNTKNFNVTCYQSFPNRKSTPIRPPQKPNFNTGFKPSPDTKKEYLKGMLRSQSSVGTYLKKSLLSKAAESNIRMNTGGPKITVHGSGKLPFIMNDYHIRETNPGFARNELGNFFTH